MTYEAIYMPASNKNPSKGGFKTFEEAWGYAEKHFCMHCKGGDFQPCSGEWFVFEEE